MGRPLKWFPTEGEAIAKAKKHARQGWSVWQVRWIYSKRVEYYAGLELPKWINEGIGEAWHVLRRYYPSTEAIVNASAREVQKVINRMKKLSRAERLAVLDHFKE